MAGAWSYHLGHHVHCHRGLDVELVAGSGQDVACKSRAYPDLPSDGDRGGAIADAIAYGARARYTNCHANPDFRPATYSD